METFRFYLCHIHTNSHTHKHSSQFKYLKKCFANAYSTIKNSWNIHFSTELLFRLGWLKNISIFANWGVMTTAKPKKWIRLEFNTMFGCCFSCSTNFFFMILTHVVPCNWHLEMKQGKNLGGFHAWVLFINKLANRQIKKKRNKLEKLQP